MVQATVGDMMKRLVLVLLAVLFAAPVAAQMPPSSPDNPVVVLETTKGNITIELFKERAPVSVENFLQYVKSGHYDGTIFHRVIRGFMIQGGGMTPDMQEKPTRDPIKNEATNRIRNLRGTLAMARTAQVRSATSQFFINTAENRALDHRGLSPDEYGYAVFGKVTDGMDVIDQIERAKTGRAGPMEDVPVEPIVIKKASVKP
jgi:cyclophilin family peptidyl-prolyl cis-trans isomerase